MDYQSMSGAEKVGAAGGKSGDREGVKQLLSLAVRGDLFGVQSLMRKLDSQETFDVDRLGDIHIGVMTIEGTALMAAASGGFTGIVHYLVEHCQASPSKQNQLGANSMMLAASNGHMETISYLSGLPGINVDHQDSFDQTALMLACTEGHLSVVKVLLDAGSDVDIRTGSKSRHEGLSALELAAAANAVPIAEALLAASGDIGFLTKDGWDSLYLASERGLLGMVRMLLTSAADVNGATDEFEGLNALGVAAARGHDGVLRELLVAKADIETIADTSAVVRASDAGRLSTLELLLNEPVLAVVPGMPPPPASRLAEALQARVDYQDEKMDGATALIRSARNGHYEVCEALLNRRASIDGLDKSGDHSALLLAAENEHSDCVRLLVSRGADVHLGRAEDGGSSIIKTTRATDSALASFWGGNGQDAGDALRVGTPMHYALNSPALAEAFMDGLKVRFVDLGTPNCANERYQLKMFKRIFTAEFVSKCISLKGPAAVKCLDIIFRRPVPTATCMRLPVRSYMDSSLRTALRKDYFRPDPGADFEELILEDAGGNASAKQVPVQISCFYVPGVVCDDVLHALAITPNLEIYRTTPVQAIIDIVWQAHGLRSSINELVLEFAMVTCLCVATHITVEDKGTCSENIFGIGGETIAGINANKAITGTAQASSGFALLRRLTDSLDSDEASISALWVTLFLMMIITLRESKEELFQARYLAKRGIVQEYFTEAGNVLDWSRILMTTVCLPLLMADIEVPALLAVVAFLRWLKLLHCLNGFSKFGPKILPIMGTFRAMLPFCVVISFYIAAFSHAGWALHICEPVQQVYRLSMLGEFDLRTLITRGHDQENYQNIWFIICSFFMSVALLNVFIGVMSESYDRHQDASTMTFLRHRANINLRCYLRSHLRGNNAEHKIVNARSKVKLNFDEAYVWVNHTAKDADDFTADFEGRIAVLKRHTEEQAACITRSLDALRFEITQASEGIHSFEHAQEDLNKMLKVSDDGDDAAAQNFYKVEADGKSFGSASDRDIEGDFEGDEKIPNYASIEDTY